MKVTLDCPRAKYGAGMVIYCMRDEQPCAHQYYRRCKGWYVLSDGAKSCPMREERADGAADKAAADGKHAV